MKKGIKDYLHLYLGCECMMLSEPDSPEPNIKKLRSLPFLFGELHAEFGDNTAYSISDVKLILRPLSDMTDEEAIIISETTFINSVSKEMKAKIGKAFIDYNLNGKAISTHSKLYNDINEFDFSSMPEIIRYLLSRHFDLFGLIEAGLAIDKTKL